MAIVNTDVGAFVLASARVSRVASQPYKVDNKAEALGINLQKPMSREEALTLRDARNAVVVDALENGTWYKVSEDVAHDGVHLGMGY